MEKEKICPKCKGIDFDYTVTIPERTSNTIIAVCKSCKYKITCGDWHGKSILDKQEVNMAS